MKMDEKRILYLDYYGSGIKSMKNFSVVILSLGLIGAFFLGVFGLEKPELLVYAAGSLIWSIILFFLFKGLAGILDNLFILRSIKTFELAEKGIVIEEGPEEVIEQTAVATA